MAGGSGSKHHAHAAIHTTLSPHLHPHFYPQSPHWYPHHNPHTHTRAPLADKDLQYGDHNRDVRSHYSAKASPYALTHLFDMSTTDKFALTVSTDEGQIEMTSMAMVPASTQADTSIQETDLTGDVDGADDGGGTLKVAAKKWRKKGEKLKRLTNPMEQVALSKLAALKLKVNSHAQ